MFKTINHQFFIRIFKPAFIVGFFLGAFLLLYPTAQFAGVKSVISILK
jgi:hypothetical protein